MSSQRIHYTPREQPSTAKMSKKKKNTRQNSIDQMIKSARSISQKMGGHQIHDREREREGRVEGA